MQISTLQVHNFRSIQDCTLSLDDYSLMVGANNSGKSNVMDALRIFYEKGLKYDRSRDFPKFDCGDKESWVEIEYTLTDDEYSNLKDEWKQPNNRLKVRKYFDTSEKGKDGKTKLGIFAYNDNQEIADEHFYGAKNVQQGKLGEIIYIPAASKLDEQTKLTGPSPLRELLNDILKKLVKTSTSFQKLTSEFDVFSEAIKNEETEDKKSLRGLEEDITSNIEEWGANFELRINSVTETDIVKNLVSYKIIDQNLGEDMDASQFGQGFQRHLIFTLIRTAANYQVTSLSGTKKEFKPDLTVLLFEEPEAFLHPIQQGILCRSLKLIGESEGNQIFISSHSPNFVSHNSDDLPSLIRLTKEDRITATGQVTIEELENLFSDNLEINEMLKGTEYEAEADDLNEEMEAVKYFLWLSSERCGVFFAHQIILVEGSTERMLLDYLFDTNQVTMPAGGVFVLDCLGKFNIHRFMNLLGRLKIRHSVLFDADKERPPHPKIRQLIEESRNELTRVIDTFPNDVEDFLGIEKCGKPHRKPQHVMLKIRQGDVTEDNISSLIEKVEGLIN